MLAPAPGKLNRRARGATPLTAFAMHFAKGTGVSVAGPTYPWQLHLVETLEQLGTSFARLGVGIVGRFRAGFLATVVVWTIEIASHCDKQRTRPGFDHDRSRLGQRVRGHVA